MFNKYLLMEFTVVIKRLGGRVGFETVAGSEDGYKALSGSQPLISLG